MDAPRAPEVYPSFHASLTDVSDRDSRRDADHPTLSTKPSTLTTSTINEKLLPKNDVDEEKRGAECRTVPVEGGTDAPLPPAVPGEVPDGGALAWLQVVACWFLMFNSWGIINTFGAYQTFYQEDMLSATSPGTISWIGSIQGFLLLLIGVLNGPIFDMGYGRVLVWVGTFMVVFGMMMTSIATRYWEIVLAQGVCVGLGAGCLFIPSVAIIATYFKKRRAFATGVGASGSSIGGVIYPIVFHQLQPRIGFGWATRVIGFIALGTLAISSVLIRQRITPKARRALIDVPALKEPAYMLFNLALFLGFMGLYIPFFYISAYAAGKTGADASMSFYFLPIVSAASTFGRILPNFLADRVGPLNMLIPCALAAGVLILSWISVRTEGNLAAFAVFYGFFSGTFVSLPPSTIAWLSPDMSKVGTRMGMTFGITALGLLIGTPIAGTLINLETADYLHAQIFGGVLMLAGVVALVAVRFARVGATLFIKT